MIENEKILVIIPAYNEEECIGDVIQSIKARYPYMDVLVVDDGSTDETSKAVKLNGNAKLIQLPYNIGIGGSVQTGFIYAQKWDYHYAIQFDGDGQHMVKEIPTILNPVINDEADCVIGSRFIQKLKDNYQPDILRRFGIFLLRSVSYLYIGQRISDQTSGFRAYNRKCIHLLSREYPKDFPEAEVIIFLGINKLRLKEVFTQMRERQGGVSSIATWRGPYYIFKVLLSMTMARLRNKMI